MKLSLDTTSALTIAKRFRYGSRVRPDRDWLILLGTSVVLLAISLVFNTLLFLRVQQGDVLGTSATSVHTDTPASLSKVKMLFESRATEKAKYQSQYHFVDPSHSGS